MLNLIPAPQKCSILNESKKKFTSAIHTDVEDWDKDVEIFCDYFEKIPHCYLILSSYFRNSWYFL